MKILVTGFEPFAGATLNPSGEIAKRLEGEGLLTAVLPVEYDAATARVLELVSQHKPDAVIALGQAEGRSTISFERIAVNLDDAKLADNAGVTRVDSEINPDGAAAYFSTLPIREMVDAVNAAGIPASLSLSAGTFVCNHIFYELQQALAGPGVASGFVHVPLMTEQAPEFEGKPTMDIDTQVRAIEIAVATLQNGINQVFERH